MATRPSTAPHQLPRCTAAMPPTQRATRAMRCTWHMHCYSGRHTRRSSPTATPQATQHLLLQPAAFLGLPMAAPALILYTPCLPTAYVPCFVNARPPAPHFNVTASPSNAPTSSTASSPLRPPPMPRYSLCACSAAPLAAASPQPPGNPHAANALSRPLHAPPRRRCPYRYATPPCLLPSASIRPGAPDLGHTQQCHRLSCHGSFLHGSCPHTLSGGRRCPGSSLSPSPNRSLQAPRRPTA